MLSLCLLGQSGGGLGDLTRSYHGRIGLSVYLPGMTKFSTPKRLALVTPVLILMPKNLTPGCSSQGSSRVKLPSETGGLFFLSPIKKPCQ